MSVRCRTALVLFSPARQGSSWETREPARGPGRGQQGSFRILRTSEVRGHPRGGGPTPDAGEPKPASPAPSRVAVPCEPQPPQQLWLKGATCPDLTRMFEKYSEPLCARVTGLGGRSRPQRLWLNYIPLSAPRKTAAVLSSLCSTHVTHKLANRPSPRPHIHAQTCRVTQVTATPTCSHTHTHTLSLSLSLSLCLLGTAPLRGLPGTADCSLCTACCVTCRQMSW